MRSFLPILPAAAVSALVLFFLFGVSSLLDFARGDKVQLDGTYSDDVWDSLQVSNVKVHKTDIANIESMDDLYRPSRNIFGTTTATTTKHEEIIAHMKRFPHPFEEGWLRYAYLGKMAHTKKELEETIDTLPTLVMKQFKQQHETFNRRQHFASYLTQMEISNTAEYLAQIYNKYHRPPHCPEIHFLQVSVIEEVGDDVEQGWWQYLLHKVGAMFQRPSQRRRQYYNVEEALPAQANNSSPSGGFMRFNTCYGGWTENVPTDVLESLSRYTLFTYFGTHRNLLVADLQGTWSYEPIGDITVDNGCGYGDGRDGQNNKKFIYLTDPAILTKDRRTKFRHDSNNYGPEAIHQSIKAAREIMDVHGWAYFDFEQHGDTAFSTSYRMNPF